MLDAAGRRDERRARVILSARGVTPPHLSNCPLVAESAPEISSISSTSSSRLSIWLAVTESVLKRENIPQLGTLVYQQETKGDEPS